MHATTVSFCWTIPCSLCSLVTRQNFCVLKTWILSQWRAAMLIHTQLLLSEVTVTFKVWLSFWHLFSFCPSVFFSSVSSRASLDWLSSMKNHFWGKREMGQRGAEGRICDSILYLLFFLSPYLSFTLLLLHLTGFMCLISGNLAVTRHCTQPLLIFNEGSGSSAAAFWAFNSRVFRHFCSVTL